MYHHLFVMSYLNVLSIIACFLFRIYCGLLFPFCICCLLLVIYYWLSVMQSIVCYWRFILYSDKNHYSWSIIWSLPFLYSYRCVSCVYYLLFIAYCLLFMMYHLVRIIHYISITATISYLFVISYHLPFCVYRLSRIDHYCSLCIICYSFCIVENVLLSPTIFLVIITTFSIIILTLLLAVALILPLSLVLSLMLSLWCGCWNQNWYCFWCRGWLWQWWWW